MVLSRRNQGALILTSPHTADLHRFHLLTNHPADISSSEWTRAHGEGCLGRLQEEARKETVQQGRKEEEGEKGERTMKFSSICGNNQ